MSPIAIAQTSMGSSDEMIKDLLANVSRKLETGDSSKAVQDLLMVQRLLALNNDNFSSTQDSRLLIRQSIGALLNNRPDIATENLDTINKQLFPLPQQNMAPEIINGTLEKPEPTTIQSTLTDNGSSKNVNADLINGTLGKPTTSTQATLPDNSTTTDKATNNLASTNFLNFTNPVFGIKIQYPDTWSARGYQYNIKANNTVVGFYSPSKTASQLGNISGVSGQFVPYLDIFVFDSKNMSLDRIINGRMSRIQNNTDTILETKAYTLKGNLPAHMLIYTTIAGGDEFFKKMQVYTVSGNKVYLITYTAQEALFSVYMPVIKKMIDSFELRY
ncbi:MAG TPA: PsbP-related protein [Nitrososphaeraceae archaeon]|nr:PsbP-related protein [Nitrososphaeraceae archaeon]